ncbi:MAG: TonB-dependent receptor domain-containing protein, partial [Candidatus Heimdallarchaeota archaeon]
ASRRPEKLLEAPASITVLDAQEIEARPTLTVVEHLKALPAVDMIQPGLNQSRVVVRGFNTNFTGSLLSVVDNRIARIPSLRLNVHQFIPTSNEDVERIEIVSGPASALYGPNSANGVMHILTKSPFGSEGTTVSFGGGERSLFMSTLRHAGSFNNKIGYKFSVQYYQGNDFKFTDVEEEEARQAAIAAGADPKTLKIGARDFNVEKIAAEGRFDFRLSPDFTVILNGGFNQGSNLELTPISTAQALDWTYSYIQARFNYKDLFLQAFVNRSDAGDTYILRTGQPIIDKSKLFVAQAQHTLGFGDRQRFTYGLDLLLTRPDTEGSIHGDYEDDDNTEEIGAYLQSETTLSSKLDFVAAARIDDHTEFEDVNFSPRAALVFKPTPTDNFRLTYNRAFATPRNSILFADIVSRKDIFGLGGLFEPVLGFGPSTDLRAQANNPTNGFHFSRGVNGLPQFHSPFAPLDPRGISTSTFIDLNDPIFTNVMWGVGRQAVLGAFLPTFQALLAQQGLPPEQIAALTQAFITIVPQQVSGVNNVLRALDIETSSFNLVEDVEDIKAIEVTRTETFEAGYKGILGQKLVLGIDVYHSRVKNFIGPLFIGNPNVFLDPATLGASLAQQFAAALADPNNANLNAILLALDDPALGGNGNGSAVDELSKLFVAGTNNNGAAFIPFGTVSPAEAFDPTALLLVRRNFGNISLTGLDLSFTYYTNKHWSFSGNYSYVSDNFFKNLDDVDDLALNAPKHKFGAMLQYRNPEVGFDSQLRLRFVDSFRVKSDIYIGTVKSYAVLDLNANYTLPFSPNTRLTLTIQNVTDNKHREFVGVPEIGRIAFMRLTQSF